MKRRQRPTRRRPIKLSAWQTSQQFRDMGRAELIKWNAQRIHLPRCEAIRKSDGESCRQWPMKNGRCYFHGGRTPKGKNWHLSMSAPDIRRMERKLEQKRRDAEFRARQLAWMSDDERAAYKRWQRSHRPGPPETRRREREHRRQDREAAKLFARTSEAPAANAEASALEEAIKELRERAAHLSSPNVFD